MRITIDVDLAKLTRAFVLVAAMTASFPTSVANAELPESERGEPTLAKRMERSFSDAWEKMSCVLKELPYADGITYDPNDPDRGDWEKKCDLGSVSKLVRLVMNLF